MKFRTDTDVKDAFDKAFNEVFDDSSPATQKEVDNIVKAVGDAAEAIYGGQGLYVSGILNPDMQCVSFQFKRPGISQRVQHTIACDVPVPERPLDDNEQDDAQNNDYNDTGSPQDRLSMFQDLTALLKEDDFTSEGKPKVEALNALLKPEEEQFTAAERDRLCNP